MEVIRPMSNELFSAVTKLLWRLKTVMNIRKKAVLAFLLAALGSMTAMGGSATIPYQGMLKNADGSPVADGNYAMVFSIWDAATAGTQRWIEPHPVVAVKNGTFLAQLGETAALGALFSTYGSLWLQIEADTGSGPETYDPRVPLSSATYAKHAENAANATNATNAGNADTVDAKHASDLALVSHNHAGENITSGTISTDRYSAYADLVAETKIGAGAAQVAAGNHWHSSRPFFVGQVGGELTGTKTLQTVQASGITNTGTTLVATVAGRYLVHFQQLTRTAASTLYVSIRLNGALQCYGWFNANYMQDMIVERIVTMNAGDAISFAIEGGAEAECWGGVHSTVSMFLIG